MSRPIKSPKYNPGDKVIVKTEKSNWIDGGIRGATVLSVWFDHRDDTWVYNITEGVDKFMTNHILEKDVVSEYTPSKMIHYASKGL